MDVHQAEFVLSAARPGDYPPPDLPEVCFAGRSNVGKSSLLNVLLGRRRLVKVSSRPGKTRLINFFRVDDAWSLVDLPGYGYAAVSRTERRAFGERVEAYLRTRTSLRACVLLLDVRHPPREEECLFLESLSAWDVRSILVATKVDKVSKTARGGRVQSLADRLGVTPKAITPFSAPTREGREALWRRIAAACR